MNRVIKRGGLDAVYMTGPGHGAPGLVAYLYLEGTYTDVQPHSAGNGPDANGRATTARCGSRATGTFPVPAVVALVSSHPQR